MAHTTMVARAVVAAVVMLATRDGSALTVPELLCQQSIGKEALRFVQHVQKAERRCADADAIGQTCDEAKRDADVAAALEKLVQRLAGRCDGIALEQLGFPASCDDADGSPFTTADLAACIDSSHRALIAGALAVAYPGAPATLAGDDARCQRAIGVAATRLVEKRLRARQSCSNDQLSGRIALSVDCRADPAPQGPGTGHAKTDRRLLTAAAHADVVIARGCAGVALEDLGFPGLCADPGGAPFTVGDLQGCVRDDASQRADELLDIEYAR